MMKKYEIQFNNLSVQVVKHNYGAYGDIFLNSETNIVYKVFKKTESSDYKKFVSLKTFESEAHAQETLKNSIYTPNYYGVTPVINIFFDGKCINERYYLKQCYSMEFIQDRYEATNFREEKDHLSSLGVRYLIDADILKKDNLPKFIDIGVIGVLETIEELCNYNELNFNNEIEIRFNEIFEEKINELESE